MSSAPPSPSSNAPRLVVIGASAGGVFALRELAAALPAGFAAPVLVVQHIGAHESILPQLIAKDCRLSVAHALDGEALQPGTIRIAPSDRHLIVRDGCLRLLRSPKENFARPAIDPLFRTAALEYRECAIGVILTGMLDDGTAGLRAIKQAGGIAVVQDPLDAVESSMPASALRHVAVDHCVPLREMSGLLSRLVASPAPARSSEMPDSRQLLLHEQGLSDGTGDHLGHLRAIGTPSPLTCPECHGGLWQIRDDEPIRYRCHTGHAFTMRTLDVAVGEATDAALWNALRALQERAEVLEQLAASSREVSDGEEAARHDASSHRVTRQAGLMRKLLERSPDTGD
jgi:two-component system chemotaxis response regulator CheB